MNAQRTVEVYNSADGFLISVQGSGEFIVSPRGESIGRSGLQPDALRQFERAIILGPVIVFALALRNVWSLHASAARYKENVTAFLGESGQGKSTLAGYLSQNAGWQLVADDILPVRNENGLQVLPHFPQLKLQASQQPGISLPEQLKLNTLCLLEKSSADVKPKLQEMNTAQTVQALLAHVAGTRMFSAELLTKHLKFSTQSAPQVKAYKLTYPHRRETLPQVKQLLEEITCQP